MTVTQGELLGLADQLHAAGVSLRPQLPGWLDHKPRVILPEGKVEYNAKQAAFLSPVTTLIRDVYYGGAAGGGKSDALLMAALQYVHVPSYSAVIVRKNYPMLDQPGGLIQRAREWLVGHAKFNAQQHRWSFPSGATLSFRHLQNSKAIENYQGSEYDFIGVDEVTDFSLEQFRFLFSRLRRIRSSPVPLRVRSASNPIGPGKAWVEARYVRPTLEGRIDVSRRAFISARLEDNPALDQEGYDLSLRELGAIVYAQLRWGDWDVKNEGTVFKRWWFPIIERAELPPIRRAVRYWDLAATETPKGKVAREQNDPDWTAGLLLSTDDAGRFFVEDVNHFRESPAGNEERIAAQAESDGRALPIRMEQEGGASGKSLISSYRRRILPGFDLRGRRPSGDKETRAQPVAASAEQGEVILVKGAWIEAFLDELADFPEGLHDDQVDALSGAFEFLTGRSRRTIPPPISLTKTPYWRGGP